MFDILKCSIRNITRKKIRSLLTILGVTIGVTSVILINNIAQCGNFAIRSELNSLGIGGLTISTNTPAGINSKLSGKQLDIIKESEYVKQAMPIVIKNIQATIRNKKTNALAFGVSENASQIISLEMLYGRGINKIDTKNCYNVCVVDQNFSKKLYHRDNIVGKKINLSADGVIDSYEVVGVIKSGSGLIQNLLSDYIPNFIYIPYTTLQRSIGTKTFDQIAIRIDETKNISADEIGERLKTLLSVSEGISDAYNANNLSKQKEGLTKLLDIMTVILSIVGAISLIVASLSIMTVMLVSVSERTREIGIKKSIGASKFNIMAEFLCEAVIITISGCILGLFIGNILSFAAAVIFHLNFVIKTDSILSSILFAAITGIIFGAYPAVKACKLKPVDALRL